LWQFGIFSPRFGILSKEESGNPGCVYKSNWRFFTTCPPLLQQLKIEQLKATP
jgi:hypothetical protein